MAKELYATSHWKSLQEEQLTITDLLSTVLFHPRLYTMGELQNCFTRWSLSSSAIQLQTKAKLLNSTLPAADEHFVKRILSFIYAPLFIVDAF